MEIMKSFGALLIWIGMLVFYTILLKQEIKEIKKIKVKSNDGNIKAIVIFCWILSFCGIGYYSCPFS